MNENEISNRSIAADVIEYEQQQGFFDVEIRGIPIWERLRNSIPGKIKQNQNLIKKAHRHPPSNIDSKWINYSTQLKRAVLNAPHYMPFTFDEHEVLFWGHSRRKKQSDGYWWDIYTDPLQEQSDFDYIQFEKASGDQHRRPAKTDNLFYIDEVPTYARILRKLGYGSKIKSQELESVRDLEEKLRSRFSLDIDIVDSWAYKIELEHAKKIIYSSYLDRINPNIAVIVVGYNKEPFILSCQKNNIPVVELQHGVIHEGHLAYHYPGDRTKEAFPDYLLVWGEFWKDCVDYPIPDKRVIPVGYPYLEQSVKKYNNITSSDQILFISQGTIGEQLSKFALAVNKHPDIHHDIVYKLHPGEYYQWEEEYPWLADAPFEVIDNSNRGLYRLFAESSIQIGVASTAVYEGLCFDLETYVYDCTGSSVLEPLTTEGTAKEITSADELACLLERSQGSFDRKNYFEPDATTKMCNEIQQLSSDGTVYSKH